MGERATIDDILAALTPSDVSAAVNTLTGYFPDSDATLTVHRGLPSYIDAVFLYRGVKQRVNILTDAFLAWYRRNVLHCRPFRSERYRDPSCTTTS